MTATLDLRSRRATALYARAALGAALSALSCALLAAPAAARAEHEGPAQVTQELRYELAEAGEVFLVWGVAGWGLVTEESRPPGTVVEFGVMHTPMVREGERFVARITVPAGTAVDYGFQTRSTRAGGVLGSWVFDGDYRLLAAEDGTLDVAARVTLPAGDEAAAGGAHASRRASFAARIVVPSILLALTFVLTRKRRAQRPHAPLTIVATGVTLACLLVLVRARVVGVTWTSWTDAARLAPHVVAAASDDLRYVVMLTSPFLVLALALRRRPAAALWAARAHSWAACVSLLAALVNVELVRLLGAPLTYEWLYYSQFLGSLEAQTAIAAAVTWQRALEVACVMGGFLLAARALGRSLACIERMPARATAAAVLALIPAVGWRAADRSVDAPTWPSAKLANPITAFVASALDSDRRAGLFTMSVDESYFEEFRRPEGSTERLHASATMAASDAAGPSGPVRNVVLIVVESAAAEYLEPYGGTYPVTPELKRRQGQSLVFRNVYAHAPASNKSLVSLLASLHPWLSYRSITEEHPALAFPTLGSELERHGYRTAFFGAGNMDFQRAFEFLAHRGFDVLRDARNLECDRPAYQADAWGLAGGMDEHCLVDAFERWQAEEERPFFAMLWTIATHYPYAVLGPQVDYGVEEPTLSRYLNGIRRTDEAIGRLLAGLERRGQLNDTLVALVGDHGEAFGRHGQWVHASELYEENVHVPFILINPARFHGQDDATVGGLVDVAPTILDVLGLRAPAAWQGRSLFDDAARSPRVYFFTPWSEPLFGYRDATRKVIYNAMTHATEVYDLASDPLETRNVAADHADVVAHAHRHLAAWAQHQERVIRELLPAPAAD